MASDPQAAPVAPAATPDQTAAFVHWAFTVVTFFTGTMHGTLGLSSSVTLGLFVATVALVGAGGALYAVEHRTHRFVVSAWVSSYAAYLKSAVPGLLEEVTNAKAADPCLAARLGRIEETVGKVVNAISVVPPVPGLSEIVSAVKRDAGLAEYIRGVAAVTPMVAAPPQAQVAVDANGTVIPLPSGPSPAIVDVTTTSGASVAPPGIAAA